MRKFELMAFLLYKIIFEKDGMNYGKYQMYVRQERV